MSWGAHRGVAFLVWGFVSLALPAFASPPSYLATRIDAPVRGGTGVGLNARGDMLALWSHASSFVVSRDGMQHLPWQVTALNDSGQVVGWQMSSDQGRIRALVFADGSTRDIHPPAARHSVATAINAGGTVVGVTVAENGVSNAFLFNGGRHEMPDLAAYGSTMAAAINAGGQVAIDAVDPQGLTRTFLYTDGEMADLGTLGGRSANRGLSTVTAMSSGAA